MENKDFWENQTSAPHGLEQSRHEKKIGVIGGGFVGSAVANFFRDSGADVKVYDKFKEMDPLEQVLQQDYLFIAVPTNYIEGEGIDLSAMDDAMANAAKSTAKAVIIKSTVIPGTTEKYQEKYPNIKILFNPEFLTESTADQDFRFTDRQIIGYTKQSYDVAGDVQHILPMAPFTRIVPATAAEIIKYFNNTWFATKVVFANQMYDVCDKLGVDYNIVAESAGADRRIGKSHLNVWHGEYRGYGGKCLPKDTRAFIKFMEEMGLEPKLLKTVEDINNELTGGKDRSK